LAQPKWTRRSVRSGLEVRVRKDLDARGIEYGYETVTLAYVKLSCPHCKEAADMGQYTPDFIIPRKKGKRLIIESKGYFDASDRSKMVKVKAANPDEDIRLLFQRDQKITKTSKTTYTSWAAKKGFICAIGDKVPEAWLKGEKE
jgi:hypothetical protein